jgi:4-hydroxybenzoate polyprenyltransferase
MDIYHADVPVICYQGLMFKVGIFMGWSDLTTESTMPMDMLGPLYLGCCLWTITYETVYQHQVRSGMFPLADTFQTIS